MEKVLIVDDDSKLTYLLKEGLESNNDQFSAVFAEDGQEAIDILSKVPISVVVTDLQMPRVDGLALLAYISENHPAIPCIVMTAHAKPEIVEKLPPDLLSFLQKPFKIKELSGAILKGLEKDVTDGSLTGISVANFTQLIELEQKTCLFEVNSPEEGKGIFYFRNGVPHDAIFDDLKGEAAALRIIAMDSAKIRFLKLPKKNIAKRIETGLMNLIMEAMRLRDEAKENDNELGLELKEEWNFPDPDQKLSGNPLEEQFSESMENNKPIDSPEKEESEMALETFIEELREIKGYKAAAIMNFTGEVLAYHSSDEKVDLAEVGATFNDIFRSSHEASQKVGLDACKELVIQTPKGLIVMECSGVDAVVHVHLIAIMNQDGNQALMKMRMNKIIPLVMEELS